VADRRPIIVAGAGIGGLTLALALARSGLRVSVAERAAALQEVGAGLQLSPNASRILDSLGLADELDAFGARPDAARIIDGKSGRRIAHLPLGTEAEQRWGAPYRVIHRADLQRILAEAAMREGAEIRLGAELLDVADTESGVVAHIKGVNGDETIPGSAFVGADGLYSAARSRLDKDEPRFSGQIAWRATIQLDAANETGLWLGPGAHLVSYRLNKSDKLNLVAIIPGTEQRRGWALPADADDIGRTFSSWSPVVRALISAPDRWTKWPLFDRPALPRWGEGRTTLIGDAAHPMLPHLAQGAAMAIEDAAVLAKRIKGEPHDLALAFRRYEADRQDRTARAASVSRRQGGIYRLSGPPAFARDAALRLMGPERLMKQLDWLYGFRAV
jgi:salicylate hydroxylase